MPDAGRVEVQPARQWRRRVKADATDLSVTPTSLNFIVLTSVIEIRSQMPLNPNDADCLHMYNTAIAK